MRQRVKVISGDGGWQYLHVSKDCGDRIYLPVVKKLRVKTTMETLAYWAETHMEKREYEYIGRTENNLRIYREIV